MDDVRGHPRSIPAFLEASLPSCARRGCRGERGREDPETNFRARRSLQREDVYITLGIHVILRYPR